ncbi:hypothetical protein [Streptomyces iconiensis]|uniref:PknH-like extracellular domain-containing protein n=1 Tax=Streptomyces iconiensis TaxID=1384038 RepID=A0ABT6ZMY9_9ACTN|nr:hypothetical protein [Streptomyces iconiensis]MDJ1130429.1 hypothetical protein [Streptomyces iconiensis]
MLHVRRTSAALLAAFALFAAGCGDDGKGGGYGGSDDDSPSPSKSASKPASKTPAQGNGRALAEKQATMALLAEGNLPSGWSQADLDDTTAAGDSPDDLSTHDRNCKQLLDAFGGDIDGQEAKTDASRSYQKSSKGPYASNRIASYDGSGTKQAFSMFKKMSDSCTKFTTHNNKVTVDFSTSKLKLPSAGDESAGVRASGKAKGGPADGSTLTLDLALARVGQSTTGVVTLNVDGKDPKLAGDLLKKSADRLQQATDGATPTPKAPAARDD